MFVVCIFGGQSRSLGFGFNVGDLLKSEVDGRGIEGLLCSVLVAIDGECNVLCRVLVFVLQFLSAADLTFAMTASRCGEHRPAGT